MEERLGPRSHGLPSVFIRGAAQTERRGKSDAQGHFSRGGEEEACDVVIISFDEATEG